MKAFAFLSDPGPAPTADAKQWFQRRRIRLTYLVSLLVTTLVGVFALVTLTQAAELQLRTADAIRLNTEQRANMQRVTRLLSLMAGGAQTMDSDALRTELSERLVLIEQNHDAFVQNHPRTELPAEVDELYFGLSGSLHRDLEEYLRHARELAQMPDGGGATQTAEFQRVLQLSPILREAYNTVIVQYDGIQQQQAEKLRVYAWVIFGGLLAVLLFEGVFIFRPTEMAIHRQREGLEAEIERRKQVESALRQSELAYRLLVQNLPDMAVMMFDRDLRFTIADGPALNAIGFSRSLVEGKTLREAVPPASYEALEPRYRQALQGSSAVVERSFGGHHYINHFLPVYDDAQNIVGGMVTAQDITARKQAEEALQASEARFRSIAENASDLVALLDEQFRFVYVNPAHHTILGFEPASLIGQSVLDYIHPDDAGSVRASRLSISQQGARTEVVEYRHLRADGQYVWLETHSGMLYGADGAFQGLVSVKRDLTERRRLQSLELEQERLQTSLAKERELSDLKTRMMVRIAHEFRTPLAVIWSSFETLDAYSERLSVEQRSAKRHNIQREIGHITRMLDDIHLVVNGNVVLRKSDLSPIDLAARLQQLVSELDMKPDQRDRVTLTLPARALVRGNRDLLDRAFNEILSNAVRFSNAGTPIRVVGEQRGESVAIAIIDAGIGIPSADLPRISEPFFRGSNTNERQGLGTGLAIAKAVITAHQGTIAIRSQQDVGTTVEVILPLIRTGDQAEPPLPTQE